MSCNKCEIQQDRLSKFFAINYGTELEHDEQKKLNILKEPKADIHKDVIFNLSQSAKYNFITGIHPTKKIADDTNKNADITNSELRGISKRNIIRLDNEAIKLKKLLRSVHFQEAENASVECSAFGTIIRRLELKEEEKEIPQFQVLLEKIVQEREIQNSQGSIHDNWSFQESSGKVSETKYFRDIEETTGDSFDVIQDPNNYIMSSLYLDSPNSCINGVVADTNHSKESQAEEKRYKHHKVRFWLNRRNYYNPEVQILSHTGN